MKAQAAPNSRGGEDGGKDDQRGGQEVEIEADERDAETGDIGLSLGADIEEPGMDRDREGKAGEHEVGSVEKRVARCLRQ